MTEILRKHAFSITFLAILFGYVFLFLGDDEELFKLSGYTMGTTYNIQLTELPDHVSEDAFAAEIGELLTELDRGKFSTYAADSELSRFNRHGVNVPFIASAEMIEVLLLAQDISTLSDGAFDISVGPLVNMWGFGPDFKEVADDIPSQERIDAALETIGFEALTIDTRASQIRKSKAITLDLSAIAKGYAVDKLAEYFESLEIADYFLEIGGELKIAGLKPGGQSWVPAIEAPLDTASQIYEVFFSRGETIAVAGSGDYRNYFEVDGQRYSHEIDPRTGRPVTNTLAAAYVIDESAARADALATAFMVLGLDDATQVAEEQDLAVYFIYKSSTGDEEFEDYFSDEFAYYLQAN